jgi:phosphopantothenoylcysteine decarboxylase / phosphopantothenate---cysteine ligase
MSASKKILILITGSIACYKVATVISNLKQKGHDIKVVMSPSSLQFLGASTVEGLTGQAPLTDMYSSGNVMDHIHLMRWADLILVAPATAHYINKIAGGLGDDLLTTLFLAHDFEKPFLVAPAMNTKMYLHPVTQNSISALKKMGVKILETASGVLACGEIGSGRLLDPQLIIEDVENNLNIKHAAETKQINQKNKTIKILVTGGGTIEKIDDVRFIANNSTGKTANYIVETLNDYGFDITYLKSKTAERSPFNMKIDYFETSSDLQELMQKKLAADFYDYVIHCAAVSDYTVKPFHGKISSHEQTLSLELHKTPKIIDSIKKWSANSQVIGFKLTSHLAENEINEKVHSLFQSSSCDYIVQNDWSDVASKNNKYQFYKGLNQKAEALSSLEHLVNHLTSLILKTENL